VQTKSCSGSGGKSTFDWLWLTWLWPRLPKPAAFTLPPRAVYFLRNYRPILEHVGNVYAYVLYLAYRISSSYTLISPWVNTIARDTTKYLPSSGLCSLYADFTSCSSQLAAKENTYVCSTRPYFEVHARLTSTYSITSLKNSDYWLMAQ
jgi:hypothetical protein